MKILWIVNMILPKLANYLEQKTSFSGSWMEDASTQLSNKKGVKLAIACVGGKKFKKIEVENIIYFMIPGNGKKMLFYHKSLGKYWDKIIYDFKPDLVHIHGTEYTHSISYLRNNYGIPTIVSIQGILNKIKNVDFGEMKLCNVLFYRTLKEMVKFNGMLEMRLLHKKNAKYEREIIKKCDYANCVNTWDASAVLNLNPDIKIYQLEYNLREGFYNSQKWDLTNHNRYDILTNPGGTPLKGLHKLLEALSIVKREIPNFRLKVPGFAHTNGKLKVTSGYSKYIKNLIKKYNLNDNVIFLGGQTEKQMIENMLSSRMVVIPSAIEGTSLILREAMYLGVPTIASFRGGMADYIDDKKDGFLYDYSEVEYLATRIKQLMDSDELCAKFSINAISKAEKSHDRIINSQELFAMYTEILEKERNLD